jgi:hypothetical protein
MSTSSSSSNTTTKQGTGDGDDPYPELQIASFFVPSTLLGAQDVPLPQGRGVHQPLSSNLAGAAITSLMTSLNIVKQEQVLKDSILHNVSVPWRRQSGRIAALITDALMKSDSNTLGVDSSHGKGNAYSESGDNDHLRRQRVESYLKEADVSYVYPILQKPRPIGISNSTSTDPSSTPSRSAPYKRCTTMPSSQKHISTKFEPWSTSRAVLKYTLRGSSSGAGGQMMDNTWGYIYIPISAVARAMETRRVEKKNKKNKKEKKQAFEGYFGGLFGGAEKEQEEEEEEEGEGEGEEICAWCDVQWTPSFSQTFTSTDYSDNIGDLDNPYSVMTQSRGRSETVIEEGGGGDDDPGIAAGKQEAARTDEFFSVQSSSSSLLSSSSSSSSSISAAAAEGTGSLPCSRGAQVFLRLRLDKTLPPAPAPASTTASTTPLSQQGGAESADPHEGLRASTSAGAAAAGIPGVSLRELELSR